MFVHDLDLTQVVPSFVTEDKIQPEAPQNQFAHRTCGLQCLDDGSYYK